MEESLFTSIFLIRKQGKRMQGDGELMLYLVVSFLSSLFRYIFCKQGSFLEGAIFLREGGERGSYYL